MERLFCEGCGVPIDAELIAPTMMRVPDGRATYHDGGMAVHHCADRTWVPLGQTQHPTAADMAPGHGLRGWERNEITQALTGLDDAVD